MPTTIHNQESKAEEEFFMIKKGDYLKLYDTLNLDISYFVATNQSSLKSYISFMNPNVNAIMVHNTFSDKSDIENANQRHTHLYWCFCPNANLYIEDALPNLNLFSSLTEKLLIGTDSLASNHRLSIIEEINILQQKFPDISINNWLHAATFNGAKALGIEDKFGLITVGKKSGLNLISGVSGKMKVKVLT
jgi:cytosine/adenosine deaminase-related metal-dependent hydrolase